jgi:hypothetical protein
MPLDCKRKGTGQKRRQGGLTYPQKIPELGSSKTDQKNIGGDQKSQVENG